MFLISRLFSRKPKTSLGIDIGASKIKLVELAKEEERYTLKTYGLFSLVEYLGQLNKQHYFDPLKMPASELAEIIRFLIKQAGAEASQACFSIPVYHSFSTLIDFPEMPAQEIEAAVPFEARKYIPLPISEVALDWSMVSLPSKGKAKSADSVHQVLLIAVPKEIIAQYKKIIRLVGLRVQTIEAETFSLARALVGNDKSAIVLIDTGARSSNISIVDGGYIRVAHNLDLGGIRFTNLLASSQKLNLEKAEELKKNQASPEIFEKLKPVVGVIISETREIINRYEERHGRQIEKCLLVGGALQLPGLVDYFSQELNLETSLGNPFARVAYPPQLEKKIKQLGPSLAVAVGLAMHF